MEFTKFRYLALLINAAGVLACNFHTSNHVSHPHLGKRQLIRRAEREVLDWDYANSADWHTIQPEYATCNTGTHQSPIGLQTSQGLALSHKPDFAGYTSQPEVSGTLFNWNFGPAYTLKHEGEDFSTLPAMKFDDQTVFLKGWHIHFPSEHLVDGVRSRAEMHLVHVDAAGEPKSVVGVRIEPTSNVDAGSAFLDQLPENLIHFNDTSEIEGVMTNPMSIIDEVDGLGAFWTYQGSLTTPPCSEGLRWFIPKQPLLVSETQMVKLLGSAKLSHRVEQTVWLHQINV